MAMSVPSRNRYVGLQMPTPKWSVWLRKCPCEDPTWLLELSYAGPEIHEVALRVGGGGGGGGGISYL